MSRRNFVANSGWIGTVTLALGMAAVVQAATIAKPTDQPSRATRLLREIKVDATQVQSAAEHLEGLTRSGGATWIECDRQWNVMKPHQEDMQMKLWRLESMKGLSPAEQKELDQSKPIIAQIQARMHELRVLLDKPGVQTGNRMFKTYATSLRSEGGKLEHAVSAS